MGVAREGSEGVLPAACCSARAYILHMRHHPGPHTQRGACHQARPLAWKLASRASAAVKLERWVGWGGGGGWVGAGGRGTCWVPWQRLAGVRGCPDCPTAHLQVLVAEVTLLHVRLAVLLRGARAKLAACSTQRGGAGNRGEAQGEQRVDAAQRAGAGRGSCRQPCSLGTLGVASN